VPAEAAASPVAPPMATLTEVGVLGSAQARLVFMKVRTRLAVAPIGPRNFSVFSPKPRTGLVSFSP